jgi:hypothetical protein
VVFYYSNSMRHNIKDGIGFGMPLIAMPGFSQNWAHVAERTQSLRFEGVVKGQFGAEGYPLVNIGFGRTAYANFLATKDGQPITKPVVVEQQAQIAVAS